MISLVPDSNVLIRGFLSNRNICRKLIDLALIGELTLYGNDSTYKEFCEVLEYPDIAGFIKDQLFTKNKLKAEYESLITPIPTKDEFVAVKICADCDDDEFFKIALSSGSKIIVSMDKHILNVNKYKEIYCVHPVKFMGIYNSSK